MGRLFWICVGAGLALWGRHKTVKTIDKHVPPHVTEGVKKVGSSAATFLGEVGKAQAQARQYLIERRENAVDVRTSEGRTSEGRDETGRDPD